MVYIMVWGLDMFGWPLVSHKASGDFAWQESLMEHSTTNRTWWQCAMRTPVYRGSNMEDSKKKFMLICDLYIQNISS